LNKLTILRSLLEKTETVVFDFDNVIVDSEPFHFKAYERVFSKRGHKLNREQYWNEWTSKGGGVEGEIKRHNLDMDPTEIKSEKDPLYSEYCRSGAISIFPAAVEAIKTLDKAGYTLVIASGSYQSDIKAIVRANGIENHFSEIIGKDGIKNQKPDPETYFKACHAVRTPPPRCLAIEDAEKGVKSAKGAGMHVILIETDITRQIPIEGADLKLSSINELSYLLTLLFD
jgi:beta-phosphoglucomutase